MSLQNRQIEQCTAEEVVAAIVDGLVQNPVTRCTAAVQAMDPDIAEGKQNMAAAINTKYPSPVSSANQSLNQMAKEVRTIAQTPIYIDGGEMYAAQLTGDGTLWDLYQVLNDMKNTFLQQAYGDNDFVYKCLIVAEYYKGYDSLQLRFADGYYTSDGVYYNEAQHLHPWNDANDGKANRWVCFLYKSEAPSITFDSNSTDISPRSMYIGGHIGTIAYQANGRLTELVSGVQETDVVDYFLMGTYTQSWNNITVLRNIKSGNTSGTAISIANSLSLILEMKDDIGYPTSVPYAMSAQALYIVLKGVKKIRTSGYSFMLSNTIGIEMPDLEEINAGSSIIIRINYGTGDNLSYVHLPKLCKQKGATLIAHYAASTLNLIDVMVGEMETNLNITGWTPTTILADTDKKATLISNIVNHILARVSDRSETTFLNFTVSTNMCNAIKDELVEWPIGSGLTMTLYNAFQTKGWNLLGA